MSYCEIGDCPNHSTRYRRKKEVCEIHYAQQDGLTDERVDPNDISSCDNCRYKSLDKYGNKERLITHHISYEPEKTVDVCDRCHQKIHENSDHELSPSEKQLWKADKPIRQDDVYKLAECGVVEVSFRKSDSVDKGEFVRDGHTLGFRKIEEEEAVWLIRKQINRCDIRFLDRKPWEIDSEVEV